MKKIEHNDPVLTLLASTLLICVNVIGWGVKAATHMLRLEDPMGFSIVFLLFAFYGLLIGNGLGLVMMIIANIRKEAYYRLGNKLMIASVASFLIWFMVL